MTTPCLTLPRRSEAQARKELNRPKPGLKLPVSIRAILEQFWAMGGRI